MKVLSFPTTIMAMIWLGCGGPSIKPSAYLKHILEESNGYCSESVLPGYQIVWCYLPADYMAYQELRSDSPDQNALDSLQKTFETQTHFRLTFQGEIPYGYGFFDQELPQRLWVTRADGYRSRPSGFFAEPPTGIDGRQICLLSMPYGAEASGGKFELELALPDRQEPLFLPLSLDQLKEPSISHSL